MNGRETAKAAAEQRLYQSSQKAITDLESDRARRADADRAAGHVPDCSLTTCAPDCKRESARVRPVLIGSAAHWADCETCGRQRPEHRVIVSRSWGRTERRVEIRSIQFPNIGPRYGSMYLYVCSVCQKPAAPRVINLRYSGGSAKECNGACLNGRVSCNCRCGGRCHGNGVCLGGHE